jgi:hypothetical protein
MVRAAIIRLPFCMISRKPLESLAGIGNVGKEKTGWQVDAIREVEL